MKMNPRRYKTETTADVRVTCELLADDEDFAVHRAEEGVERAIGRAIRDQFGTELSGLQIDLDASARRADDD